MARLIAGVHLIFVLPAVDVASRAGMYSFCESINRELALTSTKKHLLYFCPAVADTDAERKWLPLWKKMGQAPVTKEAVAQKLLKAVSSNKKVVIMGAGAGTFASVNHAFPSVASALLLKKWGRIMKDHFDEEKNDGGSSSTTVREDDIQIEQKGADSVEGSTEVGS